MNQINAFNPATTAQTPALDAGNKIIQDVVQQLAQGVQAMFSTPLGAGPNAFGKLHSAWHVKCGSLHGCLPPRHHCPPFHHHHGHHHHGHHHHGHHYHGHHHHGHHHHHGIFPHPGHHHHKPGHDYHILPYPGPGGCWQIPEPKVSWNAQMTGDGTAKIDLGDGYKLEINEKNSEMTIINQKTGERTRIWGDPHVEVDGKHAFDFWGTSTFTLENGTKITINTEQWKGNPNMYVASQVFITKGDNAIVVDGISQNKLGDLSVTMSNDGRAIDAANRDGWTVHENSTGSGWRTEAGNIATQQDANVTRIGGEFGPGSTKPSEAEAAEQFDFGNLAQQIGNFLIFGSFVNSMIELFGGGRSTNLDQPQTQPKTIRQFNPVPL